MSVSVFWRDGDHGLISSANGCYDTEGEFYTTKLERWQLASELEVLTSDDLSSSNPDVASCAVNT